jgi:hypothetical protein
MHSGHDSVMQYNKPALVTPDQRALAYAERLAEARYKGFTLVANPTSGRPAPWSGSPHNPDVVFVANDNGRNNSCKACALQQEQCTAHPCHGGAWLTREQAALVRLDD